MVILTNEVLIFLTRSYNMQNKPKHFATGQYTPQQKETLRASGYPAASRETFKVPDKFSYANTALEKLPCNLCDGNSFEVIATRDRNPLPVTTVICRDCGLVAINPRHRADWYRHYYREEYRNQMARFKGLSRAAVYTPEYHFNKTVPRGRALLELMQPYIKSGLTVEVGSSAGGILYAFREGLGVSVLGIEPSPEEAAFARLRGIETIESLIEDLTVEVPKAENVLSFRSLNHMLDPRGFFLFANRHLELDGRLVLEVMHFLNVAKEYQYLPRAIQIDHVFMFTPQVLRQYAQAFGFEVIYEGTDRKGGHMYLVARKVRDEATGADEQRAETYGETMAAIRDIHSSAALFFLNHRVPQYANRHLYKTKSALKRVLKALGLYTARRK